ncbi:MAG: GIY-YIG nuclease family protein [Parvibaculum sp.]
MKIMFNMLLQEAGIPSKDVCLLRHKDQRADKGHAPYELWRDDREAFEQYQSKQTLTNRPKLTGAYWASFVGMPDGKTLFVGIYQAKRAGILREEYPGFQADAPGATRDFDTYDLTPAGSFNDFDGKLFIEWGLGTRSWIQRAGNQNKPVVELREAFKEPEFPGFLAFQKNLSEISALPSGWAMSLRAAKGIYLLTCPRTREQYVGKADGADGFWGRWQNYVADNHGGNIGLKSRDPSDYEVCILEVAGSRATSEEIYALEALWKAKLRSREMGLNRN